MVVLVMVAIMSRIPSVRTSITRATSRTTIRGTFSISACRAVLWYIPVLGRFRTKVTTTFCQALQQLFHAFHPCRLDMPLLFLLLRGLPGTPFFWCLVLTLFLSPQLFGLCFSSLSNQVVSHRILRVDGCSCRG